MLDFGAILHLCFSASVAQICVLLHSHNVCVCKMCSLVLSFYSSSGVQLCMPVCACVFVMWCSVHRAGTTDRTTEGGHVTLLPWRLGCHAVGGAVVGCRPKTPICSSPTVIVYVLNADDRCSETGSLLFVENNQEST